MKQPTFDFLRFCVDKSIPTSPSGHKHARPGWINVECPLCTGNAGFHLGFDTENNFFKCWRCGWHKHIDVIQGLLRCSRAEARSVLGQYGSETRPSLKEITEEKHTLREVSMPTGSGPLASIHRKYLRSRNFDPGKLETLWGLRGTGPIGRYKFRIIAPIYYGGRIVSYQGRDITDLSPLRYKACSKENEIRDHKHCLYGSNLVGGSSVVVVEGITDVWRLGPGAVATFGIEFTTQQINLLRAYENKYIMFDFAESKALDQAIKLANQLSVFPGRVEVIEGNSGDPAELKQDEADSIMKELLCK